MSNEDITIVDKMYIRRAQIDLEEKPENTEPYFEGWVDFDIGTPGAENNYYSMKIYGSQEVISWCLLKINEMIVGAQLSRHLVDGIKKFFNKHNVEVHAEQKGRMNSAGAGTK